MLVDLFLCNSKVYKRFEKSENVENQCSKEVLMFETILVYNKDICQKYHVKLNIKYHK